MQVKARPGSRERWPSVEYPWLAIRPPLPVCHSCTVRILPVSREGLNTPWYHPPSPKHLFPGYLQARAPANEPGAHIKGFLAVTGEDLFPVLELPRDQRFH